MVYLYYISGGEINVLQHVTNQHMNYTDIWVSSHRLLHITHWSICDIYEQDV